MIGPKIGRQCALKSVGYVRGMKGEDQKYGQEIEGSATLILRFAWMPRNFNALSHHSKRTA